MRYLFCLLAAAAVAVPLVAAEVPKMPRSLPPEVGLATVSTRDGAVMVELLVPQTHSVPAEREVELNGKKVKATVYVTRPSRWAILRLEVDGKEVQAFDLEGKAIAPEQLPKLLGKKHTPVALFKDVDPDPYYLRMLREGTVVIRAPESRINPPRPKD
jgi:hypothetical protein